MKRLVYTLTTVFVSLLMVSCGAGTNKSQLGSSLASSLLGGTNGSTGQATSNLLGSVLGALLGNTTTVESIEGTWTYSAPKIVFESENVLAKIGSSVASSKIESTLSQQLERIGFKAGKSTLTFAEDGTCVLTLNDKTMKGTYTYDAKNNAMSITGALGVTKVNCTCSVVGNEMYLLFDANKLLTMATTLSGKSNLTSSLTSLLGNYSGLKIGWTMKK